MYKFCHSTSLVFLVVSDVLLYNTITTHNTTCCIYNTYLTLSLKLKTTKQMMNNYAEFIHSVFTHCFSLIYNFILNAKFSLMKHFLPSIAATASRITTTYILFCVQSKNFKHFQHCICLERPTLSHSP